MDFSKVARQSKKMKYLYRCTKCKDVGWYIVPLAEYSIRCTVPRGKARVRCNGDLELLEEKEDKDG